MRYQRISVSFLAMQLLLLLFAMACLYPFMHVVSLSLSSAGPQLRGEVGWWPRGFTLYAYERIIAHGEVLRGLFNSVYYTVVGTSINLLLTSMMAYGLSKKRLALRSFYMVIVVITMFFSGGLIPLYLLVRRLGLYNSIWAVVLPPAISAFNLIILRTFFQSVPDELEESAFVEGATDITVFRRIALPVSKAAIATIALFYAVTHWNDWFNPFIYFRDRARYPLPLLLREVVIAGQIDEQLLVETADVVSLEDMDRRNMLTVEGIKYATLVVSIVPMILLYPFLQRYFVKGVMIGSLRG